MQQHKVTITQGKMKSFAQNFGHTNLLTPEEVGHMHMHAAYFKKFHRLNTQKSALTGLNGVDQTFG